MSRTIIPYDPKLKLLARKLRNQSTQSEIRLWHYLKGKQLYGFDFHRQKPIDHFIVDFFCHEVMLAIELDGYTHDFEQTYQKDMQKQEQLTQLGIHLLRFSDSDVMVNTEGVVSTIKDWIKTTHPLIPSQEGKLDRASS